MATTEQKKKLFKAKIAVALHDELGRVPKKEEIDQVFLLSRVMYKAVLGLNLTANPEEERTNGHFLAPMICFHEIVYIDPHGKSCRLCGIALEGYGVASPFPGKQRENERCLHGRTAWRIINKNEKQCIYWPSSNATSSGSAHRQASQLPGPADGSAAAQSAHRTQSCDR